MTHLASSRRRMPMPRARSFRPGDVLALGVGNSILIVGMWIRHGGLNDLTTPGALLTAGGQLTAAGVLDSKRAAHGRAWTTTALSASAPNEATITTYAYCHR